MASSTASIRTAPIRPLAGLSALIAKPFAAIGGFLVRMMDGNDRVREVEKLNAMSDAQLARRGLKRENIVRHVFRDMVG